jgi:hypothetical protein
VGGNRPLANVRSISVAVFMVEAAAVLGLESKGEVECSFVVSVHHKFAQV